MDHSLLTAFAYGCGLGPTQAARHLNGTVSADQLAFVDRRHVDITDLRAASADLINLYAKLELPRQWGDGKAAAADGTHFETYEDNLLAEHHIRYGKTGGIAYRHIADNYIALFSRFIACGTYEATYILDALLQNLSELNPRRIHADTHGQSAAVFGLAYLFDIELMPRIRRWRKVKLYRPDRKDCYSCLDPLFSGTVNWSLIREHYDLFMQLAIQSGTLSPSAVLACINSYSTRNRFSLVLQELGRTVCTRFLLEWIMDDSMSCAVHKCTTKIERHHRFAKHLAFGGEGLLRSNDPADQEKAIVYNELVANAVALQNVVDQTHALHALAAEGVVINHADLAFLSPYATSNLKAFRRLLDRAGARGHTDGNDPANSPGRRPSSLTSNRYGRFTRKSSRQTNYWDRRPMPPICRDYGGTIYPAILNERIDVPTASGQRRTAA
jgi:TnpA family transposase